MNAKQRWVIWAAIVVLVVSFLVPPWLDYSNRYSGYGLLLAPRASYAAEPTILVRSQGQLRVYVSLLLIEIFVLAVANTGAILALKEPRKPD